MNRESAMLDKLSTTVHRHFFTLLKENVEKDLPEGSSMYWRAFIPFQRLPQGGAQAKVLCVLFSDSRLDNKSTESPRKWGYAKYLPEGMDPSWATQIGGCIFLPEEYIDGSKKVGGRSRVKDLMKDLKTKFQCLEMAMRETINVESSADKLASYEFDDSLIEI